MQPEAVEVRLQLHFVMDLKGSLNGQEINTEPGHASKAKDASAISPPAWALLRNVQRGHLQTQRESCDRPTAHPTVSVFSCHSPSHASPAKHRAPSPVLSPLSVPLHPLLPSGQVRLDALWLFDPKLVVHVGLFWVLFLCLAGQRSSFSPVPIFRTGIPSQPLLRFVTSCLGQKMKGCMCVYVYVRVCCIKYI